MKIKGVVIHGKGEGRKLGFPTANILLSEKIVSGVYEGTAWFSGKEFRAGIFIHNKKEILEAHFLDFEGDLYGENIEVEIKEKIRDNISESDAEKMRVQIEQDIKTIRAL